MIQQTLPSLGQIETLKEVLRTCVGDIQELLDNHLKLDEDIRGLCEDLLHSVRKGLQTAFHRLKDLEYRFVMTKQQMKACPVRCSLALTDLRGSLRYLIELSELIKTPPP